MLSRRKFIFAGLGSVALVQELIGAPLALARKKKAVLITGPHSLARKAWAPAIQPDFVGLTRKGYLALGDKFGRLSVVDLRKAGDPRHPPQVLAELTGLGKRVVDLHFDQVHACALVADENEEGKKNFLVTVDLSRPESPHVTATVPLAQLKEARSLTGDRKLTLVAGTSPSGQEVILVLDASSKASRTEATIISTITTRLPVVAMLFQGRSLTTLSTDGNESQVDFIDLGSRTAPRLLESVTEKGNYTQLCQERGLTIISGIKDGACEARSIASKPAPHSVAGVKLEQLQSVLGCAMQKDRLLVLGKTEEKLALHTVSIDKHGNLLRSQEINLGATAGSGTSSAQLLWDRKRLYLAAGWSGVKILNYYRDSVSDQYTYAIPRLAASGIATWGNQAVVVGGELVRYDISQPQEPRVEARARLNSTVKSMTGAGSFILCLTRDGLVLKKMAELDRDVATRKVDGSCVAFDRSQHKAYVIFATGKVSRLFPFKVFSDSLDPQKPFDRTGTFRRLTADAGEILLFDLHSMSLLGTGATIEEKGSRRLDNLAIREAIFSNEYILATAVDQDQKGFLLVMDRKDKSLNVLGTLDLPHNGVALSVSGKTVAAVGKDREGKDLISIIDISSPTAPQIKSTLNVLESASAVATVSKIALVAGRGIEILDLG